MTPLPDQVSVLILGGMTHLARPLVCFLISDGSNPAWRGPKIKHVRIADKFLVAGKTNFTTYVDPDTLEALNDPRVEYKQANLNFPQTLSEMYNHPYGGTYDIVFDLTGEGVVTLDIPEELLLQRTTKLARSTAVESKKRNIKAHVRETTFFMTTDPSEPPTKESDVPKPKTARAYWWYEAERAAADVEGLNLAILRSAQVLGPHQYHGSALPRLGIGQVYQHTKEKMKWLWGPDLALHTIHSTDWCNAAWGVALWIADRSRSLAVQEAGERLPPVRVKDKIQDTMRENVGDGCCPRNVTPIAPVFNVVDDSDMNQGKMIKLVSQVFDIEAGFTNAAVNLYAKFNLSSVVDDINEHHANAVADMLKGANITFSPLTSFLDEDQLANRATSLDNSKIKRIIGWKPKVQIDKEHLIEIVDQFRKAGVWVSD